MLPIIKSDDTESIDKRLLNRAQTDYAQQQKTVDEILYDIKTNGDKALFDYIQKFDGFAVTSQNLLVSKQEIQEAFLEVDKALIEIMKEAAQNIKEFHDRQKRENWFIEKDG
ncbi:MAG: histidinol dehydrogenase, partial [Christensenellaceae bacterium]